jgi:transcriptional regulator of acetoin/glycerol metabolism
MTHDYPGNVRELENIIEHAFVLCLGGLIQPAHLPQTLRPPEPTTKAAGIETLRDLEGRFIYEALRRNNWNRVVTAKELGIHKTTLWRRMKQLGIELSHAGPDEVAKPQT